jgi:hypothetical protein
MKIGEDKEVAFGGHHVTKPFKDDTSRLEEGVDREHVDDDAGGKSRQKEVVLRWIASQEKDAVRRATRTFSQDDMRSERRKYLRRVKTSSSRVLKLAWCLFALYWLVCCYLIIVYGVLIYRYMGAGEEGAYITTWGMTFLLVNFGLLSLLIVGRKAFYKTFYNTWRKMFTPHFELNAWYEAYLERVGAFYSSATRTARRLPPPSRREAPARKSRRHRRRISCRHIPIKGTTTTRSCRSIPR